MSRAAPAAGPARRFVRFVVETALLIVVAATVAALLRIFVVQAFVVPSGSMLPTIQQDDRIVVSKIGDVDRGDVVVFEDPGGWLPGGRVVPRRDSALGRALEFVGVLPASDQGYLVKRLLGLPGDRVVCCDARGRVSVNGRPLVEPYLFKNTAPSAESFDVVVPRDAVWMMGDNRADSADSRPHLADGTAFVPMDNVVGSAFATVWPVEHAGGLGSPDVFGRVPSPSTPAPAAPIVRQGPGGSRARG